MIRQNKILVAAREGIARRCLDCLAGLRGSFLRFSPIESTKPAVPRQGLPRAARPSKRYAGVAGLRGSSLRFSPKRQSLRYPEAMPKEFSRSNAWFALTKALRARRARGHRRCLKRLTGGAGAYRRCLKRLI